MFVTQPKNRHQSLGDQRAILFSQPYTIPFNFYFQQEKKTTWTLFSVMLLWANLERPVNGYFYIPGIGHDLQLDPLSSKVIEDELSSRGSFGMDPT